MMSNIRRVVYSMYAEGRHPSVDTILHRLRQDDVGFQGKTWSLKKVLRKLGFRYGRMDNRIVLLEKPDIAVRRIQFLRRLKENAALPEPRYVVYMDETWIHMYMKASQGWQDGSSCST